MNVKSLADILPTAPYGNLSLYRPSRWSKTLHGRAKYRDLPGQGVSDTSVNPPYRDATARKK